MERSILLAVTALLATGAIADPAPEAGQEQQLETIRQQQSAEFHREMERRLDVLMEESLRPPSLREELISNLSAEDLLLQARSK